MNPHLLSIRYILFTLLLFSCSLGFSQDSLRVKKSLPIVYGEYLVGWGIFNKNVSLMLDFALHYQKKNHLFSLKYDLNLPFEIEPVFFTPVTPFPLIISKGVNNEYTFLYGRRWINKWASLSLSGGVSINDFSVRYQKPNNEIVKAHDTYIGFPYELSVKFFKAKKRRYWVVFPLGLPIAFPVTKPTSFGRSLGFKFFGNVSKRSYLGFGISYGLGVHRQY